MKWHPGKTVFIGSGKTVSRAAVIVKPATISCATDFQGSFSLIRNANTGISSNFPVMPASIRIPAEVRNNLLNQGLLYQYAAFIIVQSCIGNLLSYTAGTIDRRQLYA